MMEHTGPAYPSPRRGWFMVGVFFLISIVSVLDRGVLALFVDQVKHDLIITDVQIGLLQGLVFSLFYSLMGLPMGMFADRGNRRNLIMGAVALWSAATIAGAYAQSFVSLCAARVLVGIGEAMLSPAVFSMISDMFPPQARARPISVFIMGQALASGLAITIIGILQHMLTSGQFVGLPPALQAAPWRAVFAACGALGFLVLPILLMLREPRRRIEAGALDLKAVAPRAAFAVLWRGRGRFLPLYLGFAVTSCAAYGAGAWMPAMLQRSFGLTGTALSSRLGVTYMIFGIAGALTGGQIADLIARRGIKGGKMLLAALACWLALPAAFSGFAPAGMQAILMSAMLIFCYPMIGVCVTATATELAPRMRGLSIAMFGLCNGLIGAPLGPYFMALLTDHFFGDPHRLYQSIAIVGAMSLIGGSAIFVLAWFTISRHAAVSDLAVELAQ